jgi:hypothetical protein
MSSAKVKKALSYAFLQQRDNFTFIIKISHFVDVLKNVTYKYVTPPQAFSKINK